MSKPGDWICSNCNVNIFANKATCRKCGELRPQILQDINYKYCWECLNCKEYIFHYKQKCNKCGYVRIHNLHDNTAYMKLYGEAINRPEIAQNNHN